MFSLFFVILNVRFEPSFNKLNAVKMIMLAGKSLCFQIPALLTTKIVVVISPLISLMHDQCLKLAKHGGYQHASLDQGNQIVMLRAKRIRLFMFALRQF